MLFSALFSFSACSKTCTQWEIETSITRPCSNHLGKIYYPASSEYAGLELEISYLNQKTVAYLNVFSIELEGVDGKIPVTLTSKDRSETFTAFILKGGQRILLPSEACNAIIQALSEETEIQISVGRYEQSFPSTNFSNVLGELMMISYQ